MDQDHVMTIDQEVVEMMNKEMQKSPKLLQSFDDKESYCIFRVPQSLRDINKEAYQPQIVSIGPYHHENKNLEMIQEHKWRYLQGFLTRTGKQLESFLNYMITMESEIRQSCSESIEHICSNSLARMMVLDGVFLIELFRKVAELISVDQGDPIFKMVWMPPFLMRDFLRIENQIPFFVLQKLFDESKSETETKTKTDTHTLPSLILKFFNHSFVLPDEVLKEHVDLKGKHLLDFLREFFKRNPEEYVDPKGKHLLDFSQKCFIKKPDASKGNEKHSRIKPATKLVVAGVKFRENDKAKSFLEIKFKNGVLSIPRIKMDDFFTSFLLNVMAFEQCYSDCLKDITTYFVFLGCLINTSTDVSLLSDSEIIDNYFGTNEELVKFINNGKKDVSFDIKNNYLKSVFEDINDYYNDGWHLIWAELKHKYFESPWALFSLLAAIVLLLLTTLQTFYTIYPYYDERM